MRIQTLTQETTSDILENLLMGWGDFWGNGWDGE